MHLWDSEDPLGRYRLERPLATAGSDNVWLAVDVILHRRVVVTEIPCTTEDGDATVVQAQRVSDALSSAQLMSGHIETVYDVVQGLDAIYVVTEFIDAPTLADHVRERGRLSPTQVTTIARQLTQALNYAHGRDAIHGAVNPYNVRIFDDGSVKLTGFATSRVESRSPSEDDAGPYRAPERSQHSSPTRAADMWSLGATLHYALRGVAPDVRDPNTLVSRADSTSARLRNVVADLLSHEPSKRPNARELAQFLDARADPVPPVRVAPVPPPRAPRRRPAPKLAHPELLVIALGLLLLFGAGMTYALRPVNDANSLRRTAASTTPTSTPSSTANTPSTPTTVASTVVPTTSAQRPPATTKPAIEPPPAWVNYRDAATGYRIAYPQGWTVRPVTAYRTDFVEPLTGAFVRVEWTDEPGPDPVAAWRNQAQHFALRQSGYQELRIEPTTFKGHNAAEWEFRYLDSGSVRSALDIGMVTGRYGAALFATAPEPRWQTLQPTLDAFRASFEPPV